MRVSRRVWLTGASLAALAVVAGTAALAPSSFAESGGPSEEAVVPDVQQAAPSSGSGPGTGPAPAPAQIPTSGGMSPSAGTLPPGVWQWQQTTQADGTVVTSQNPSRYTISFLPDGRFAIQVDCNRGTGSYEQQGAALTLKPGAITLAACLPGG